jgi:hypothetical protein
VLKGSQFCPAALAVGPQVLARSLKELVDWVKASPTQGSYGKHSCRRLAAALLWRPVRQDRRARLAPRGQIVTTTADQLEQHKAARIRVLATSDQQRSPFLPNIATFKEAGYDIVGTGGYGVFAPAKTPSEMVEKLSMALIAGVRSPHIKEHLLAVGLHPAGSMGAELGRVEGGFETVGSCGQGIGRYAGAVRLNAM